MISDPTNITLFQLVGFTACQYYEAKANPENNPLTSELAYSVFEQQSDADLKESSNVHKLHRMVIITNQTIN